MDDFYYLKVGDEVTRMLGGKLPMRMKVTAVDDRLITCESGDAFGWTFDRKTGVEEDADLRWGVRFGQTGSYLVRDAIQ